MAGGGRLGQEAKLVITPGTGAGVFPEAWYLEAENVVWAVSQDFHKYLPFQALGVNAYRVIAGAVNEISFSFEGVCDWTSSITTALMAPKHAMNEPTITAAITYNFGTAQAHTISFAGYLRDPTVMNRTAEIVRWAASCVWNGLIAPTYS